MSIRAIVTGGFGNGTFNGTIAEVVLSGYIAGEAVTGGGTSRGSRRRRKKLKQPPRARELFQESLDSQERERKKQKETRKRTEAQPEPVIKHEQEDDRELERLLYQAERNDKLQQISELETVISEIRQQLIDRDSYIQDLIAGNQQLTEQLEMARQAHEAREKELIAKIKLLYLAL